MLLISDNVLVVKRFPIVIALAITGVGACTSDSTTDDGKLTVAVAFYPLEEIVRRVGGDSIGVATLVPPGNEPHEFEPTARQVADLENANVVFFLGNGFQPSLQRAIEALPDSVRRIDLLQGLTLLTVDDGDDPHVWLDPRNMQSMTRTIADILGEEAPTLATQFTTAADSFIGELGAVDDEFAVGLANCAVPVLVTTHRAFAYLADAYGLTHLAIAGVSPGDEPSAKALEAIAEFATENGVTTIFFEKGLPPELAETVANEIGVDVAEIATVESLTEAQLDAEDSYISIMRDNLSALRAGMDCA